jgi:quercetin dioxygenase-like cupin family protein
MQPTIGSNQGKVWGSTRLVYAFCGTEAHLIHIKKGGYCSRHSHNHKWNRFVVIDGRLEVKVYPDGPHADSTIISAGETTDVPPGLVHEFKALEDVKALEFYWVDLDPEDIDRHGTAGGVRC